MTASTEQERAEVEALAHRKAWRYKKSKDPNHSDTYTFNTLTLHDFADALLQAARRAQVVPQGWLPTADNINALPVPLRKYICDLETNADPSGMVRENTILRDQVAGLQVMYRKAADAIAAAPQPPDAAQSNSAEFDGIKTEAAQVQMPEAQAEVEVRSMKTYLDLSIHEWRDTLPDGCYKIYTENQVRQLLEAQLAELIRKEDDLLHAAIVSRPTEFGGIGFDEKEQPK